MTENPTSTLTSTLPLWVHLFLSFLLYNNNGRQYREELKMENGELKESEVGSRQSCGVCCE